MSICKIMAEEMAERRTAVLAEVEAWLARTDAPGPIPEGLMDAGSLAAATCAYDALASYLQRAAAPSAAGASP